MKRLSAILRRAMAPASLALLLAFPATGHAANKKHHITLGLGYHKFLSDDLKNDALGIDLTDGFSGTLAYRLSVKNNLDVTVDAVSIHSSDGDLSSTVSFFGPGIRFISPKEGIRPYLQANFFFVSEDGEVDLGGSKLSFSDSGAGFGVSAGVDIRAGNLLSIPIEAEYKYAKPDDDVSGIGITTGLTFNFGVLD